MANPAKRLVPQFIVLTRIASLKEIKHMVTILNYRSYSTYVQVLSTTATKIGIKATFIAVITL